MRAKAKLPLNGHLRVEQVFPDGTRLTVMSKKNLITLAAKIVVLSAIYNVGQTSDPVTTLWVGIGGSIDPQGQFPKPVAQSATGLYDPLVSAPTSFTTNNAVPSVTFIADIDQSTGNGQLITEAGLFKVSNLIFNILTFPGIPKTTEFSLHFEWTIDLS